MLPVPPTQKRSETVQQFSYNLARDPEVSYDKLTHNAIQRSIEESTFLDHQTPFNFPALFESSIIKCDWWIGGFTYDHTKARVKRE